MPNHWLYLFYFGPTQEGGGRRARRELVLEPKHARRLRPRGLGQHSKPWRRSSWHHR